MTSLGENFHLEIEIFFRNGLPAFLVVAGMVGWRTAWICLTSASTAAGDLGAGYGALTIFLNAITSGEIGHYAGPVAFRRAIKDPFNQILAGPL